MKKQFVLLSVLLVTAFAAGATGKNPASGTKVRNWTVPAAFISISVSNDIDIMLAESSSQLISIEGKGKFVDAVKLEIVNGELIITGNKHPMCGKVRVYIPVSKLQQLVVKGASEVYSMGILNSPSLRIRVEGPCKVGVKNTGKVLVECNTDYDLEYVKNEYFKMVADSSL